MKKLLYFFLYLPAFVPLFYLDVFFFPLVEPKAILFRTAVFGALLTLLFLYVQGTKFYWSRFRHWFVWIPTALLAVAYTTSFFGLDFYHSFWSVFDRSGGLLSMSYLTVYLYLVLLTFSKEHIQMFFKLVGGVASVTALYATIQWIGSVNSIRIPFFLVPEGRIGGTVGNAAFLAGYLGMTFFITLIQVTKESVRDKFGILWLVGALLQLIAIILTATRGTILALGAVAFGALVYGVVTTKGKTQYTLGAVLLAGILLVGGGFVYRDTLQKVPFEPIRRIASISKKDVTSASRLFVWKNSLQKALERPIRGYGAENISVVFDSFYDPSQIVEQWFDRTHNLYLDYFVQYGIFGLLLFLSFIGTIVVGLLKLWKEDKRLSYLLLLLMGTYVLQSFFVFDTINTLSLLYPLFAFAIVFWKEDAGATIVSIPQKKSLRKSLAVALSVLFVGTYFVTVIKPAYANLLLGKGYLTHVSDVSKAVNAFDTGLSVGTFADLEYGYQAYQMYTGRQQYKLTGEDKKKAYEFAYNTLKNNTQKYPEDARTLVYLGHVMAAHPAGVAYDEKEHISVLERAMKESPKRSQPYYMLANIYIRDAKNKSPAERKKDLQKAIDVVERYREKVPTLAEPYFILANFYRNIGDTQKAEERLAKGIELYKGDLADAKRAVAYLLAQNRVKEALPFLEDMVAGDPKNYVAMLDLARARFILGDTEGSLELVKKLQIESPETLVNGQKLLQDLRTLYQK